MTVIRHPRWLLLTLAAALAASASAYLSRGDLASQLGATTLLVAVHTALMAWVALHPSFAALRLRQVWVTVAVISVIALFAQPLLEDDHFRYLWDGYLAATTGKPFEHAPAHYFASDATPEVMRAVLSGINNPELPTIYGPVLQALFALCYAVAPAEIWPFKVMLLAAQTAVLLLLQRAGLSYRALLLLALHPLLVKESAFTAHPDLLLGLALLAATLAWRHGNAGWAAGLASSAVAIKLSALTVLPFFCMDRDGRWSTRGTIAMGATLLVLYAPVLLTLSGAETRALAALGQQWTFNPLFFRGFVALFGDKAARLLVLMLFGIAWLAVTAHWLQQLRQHQQQLVLPPIVTVLTVLLLLSPVVNPWYWLWIVPLATLQFSAVAWAGASSSLLAYTHFAGPVWARSSIITFAVPPWATGLQLLILAFAALCKRRV